MTVDSCRERMANRRKDPINRHHLRESCRSLITTVCGPLMTSWKLHLNFKRSNTCNTGLFSRPAARVGSVPSQHEAIVHSLLCVTVLRQRPLGHFLMAPVFGCREAVRRAAESWKMSSILTTFLSPAANKLKAFKPDICATAFRVPLRPGGPYLRWAYA